MRNTTSTTLTPVEPIATRRVRANGLDVNVAVTGEGPAVLLLHGWPHTWQVWSKLIPLLAADHRVIAPNLRGAGGTTQAASGYDAVTLATDATALLDALGEDDALVVGIDAGAPIAFMTALRAPDRVRALVVMESLFGRLPGAESFLAGGPPWWFGFHAVPGLAESVLVGHEREYVEWFLRNGTAGGRGVPEPVRRAITDAYAQPGAMRCGFEHYRAMGRTAEQIDAELARGPLHVPTLAVAGGVVGEALHAQLAPIARRLASVAIDDCAHLVPLEQPVALHTAIAGFLARLPS